MLESQIQLVNTMIHTYSKLKHTTNSTNTCNPALVFVSIAHNFLGPKTHPNNLHETITTQKNDLLLAKFAHNFYLKDASTITMYFQISSHATYRLTNQQLAICIYH